MYYDVVVAGGSVAGLLCAREIATHHSVLVIEEDYEIGTPEHCGGLVSSSGLDTLGIIPLQKTLDHTIESAQVFSPDGASFVINSKKQKVLEVNRRELDKQIAYQAQKRDATINVGTSFRELIPEGIRTDKDEIKCKMFVDARGISSLIQKDRTGILQSAQYEIYADWIRKDRVSVYLDAEKFPGFFAWVIPSSHGRGKVGLAGRGINAAYTLNQFLGTMSDHCIIRKIYAPIWIKGPIEKFVDGRVVTIGDAAGQAKPTT
ncbi:MAG: NAD(P)/FAD-dependent oxidoreductase, partial [Thaumarchaeota archaeon]|nr:NAD(P)/FAD-dependent oxidoreductase [Nitrososphaerota archaeon]